MASAASRTFEVAELSEMILMEIPSKDVLLLQRVNKTWLNNIGKSTKLQRKLCFEPDSRVPLKFFYTLAHESSGLISLQGWKHSANDSEEYKVRLNPLVVKVFEALLDRSFGGSAISQLPTAWQVPSASWRRMLLTKSTVEARFAVLGSIGYWEVYATRTIDTDSVRLGDIVDWVDAEYVKVEWTSGKSARKLVRILGEHMWQGSMSRRVGNDEFIPAFWRHLKSL